MTVRDNFMRLLDEKLDHVLSNPRGWGGVDALEPLVLMLLMLRAEFSAPPLPRAEVMRQYQKFLAQRVAPGAGDLRERLGATLSLEVMVKILREHVEAVRARPAPFAQPSSQNRVAQPGRTTKYAFPMYRSVESV